MGFKKQQIENYLLYETPVENLFISEYAKSAPGDYVKVYLLALMYAQLGKDVSEEKLASELTLEKRQVEDALDYWQECGLVELRQSLDGSGKKEVEFVNIKEKLFGSGTKVNTASQNANRLNDKEVSDLFKDIEKETGRLLEAKEPEAVAVWLREFGMAPSVILLGYRYCVKRNRSTRYRYVEKILMDWNERGLDTLEKVEDFLSETDRKYDFYKKVFKALGFRRNPTQAEMDVMDSWEDMGFDLSDVLEACKKTSGISSPSINYINSILVSKKAEKDSEDEEGNAKLLKAVEERYEALRNENAAKAAKIRERIYTDIPRLRDISDELMSLGIQISRGILKGAAGMAGLQETREKQKALTEERKRLLSENGYKENALDPVYTCKKCSDTGILEDGKRCSCFYDRLQEVKNGQRR